VRQICMGNHTRMVLAFWIATCGSVLAQFGQRPSPPTDLTSHPFFITKTWIVGGVGDWDSMTIDPVANQLYIAHGPAVQVVDVATGTLAGSVTGMREAHAIALDPAGEFGYVTDGPAGQVKVFDRRTFEVIAAIPTGPAPRFLALERQTKLLFVVGAHPAAEKPGGNIGTQQAPRPGAIRPSAPLPVESTLTIIDADARKQLAQIVLPGRLGFAQSDGNGRVFITVSDRNQIMRLDAQAVGSALQRILALQPSSQPAPPKTNDGTPLLDWSGAQQAPPAEARPRIFSLGAGCDEPRALALDAGHSRAFVACTNMKLVVVNADTGASVASVPIGPGADGIAYDPDRGLIFSANGDGDGSLTIIQQNVTDTYSVVQILPTRQRARTVAVDSSTGEVYLVTVLYGTKLDRPPASGSPYKMSAVDSSFQVLVVGN
jgi:DNA-binding beta-propeller fold protein YncE